ncbi:hypothetical protein [Rothia nasisuis]|uniref:hypothetical protein n=1 Tax=Rothia nasisuis TaxID=2109647 RepID=UPI001F384581|nr:hypothetical protein [Rothia nasisuis]
MPAHRTSRPALYLPTDAEMLAARRDLDTPLTFERSLTVRATGLGPWAGYRMVDAVARVRGELGHPHISYLPELADRGYRATLLARSIATLEGLGADVTASGWRLTTGYAAEGGAARALLESDINVLADAVGRESGAVPGAVKIRLLGPVSLAAQTYLTSGERLIQDAGARRDLLESLLAGLEGVLGLLTEAVPGSQLLVQFEEPDVVAASAGTLATSSGYRTHRALPRQELIAVFTGLHAGLEQLGAHPLVRTDVLALHPEVQSVLKTPVLNMAGKATAAWEPIAARLEAGGEVFLETLDAHIYSPASDIARSMWATWRDLGLPKTLLQRIVLTERGSLADTDPARATTVLGHLTETARALSEIAQDA